MRKKAKKFCRLYKYVCPGCGKNRHKRHYVRPGEICETCKKLQPPKDQNSLFANLENNVEQNQI